MSAGAHLSLSPRYLETRSEEDTEKKVESASVATALARYDLPVPGGCRQREGRGVQKGWRGEGEGGAVGKRGWGGQTMSLADMGEWKNVKHVCIRSAVSLTKVTTTCHMTVT